MANKRHRSPKKAKDPAKVAAKKARRLERQAREAAERRKAKRRRRTRNGVLLTLGVVVSGLAVFALVQALFPSELPGVEQPLYLGTGDVPAGQTVQYGTATPTSGQHSASSPRCGIYSQQVPAELAVHGLEHGVVVLWYSEENDQLAAELREIVGNFNDHVILSPNRDLDRPVVATAWNRLKSYDGADPEIEEFIDTYRNRGPERGQCPY